jgi:hypothetical protein
MIKYSQYQKAEFDFKRLKFVGRTLRKILPRDLAKLVLGLADEELYRIMWLAFVILAADFECSDSLTDYNATIIL